MARFHYKTTKDLEPKPGVKYHTTYYQQTADEFLRTRQHIQTVAELIMDVCDRDSDMSSYVSSPLQHFPRTGRQPNYSMLDIVTDMLEQVLLGKDIPNGMLGRWNRLFYNTDWDIEMIHQYAPRNQADPRVFKDLFLQ